MARTFKIKISWRRKPKLPTLLLNDEALNLIAKAAEGSIIDNIITQKQATGVPIKRNEPSTVERKRKMGWLVGGRAMALIAQMHRFVKGHGLSWRSSIDTAKQMIIIRPANAELARLSYFVQLKGYVGWFAIGNKGREAIRAVLRQWIGRQFKKT